MQDSRDWPLLQIVESLDDQPSARAACNAAGIPTEELPRYATALGTLADTGMIKERG